MAKNNLPKGCYWAIKKYFDPNIYFLKNGFKLLSQTKISSFANIDLKKLWQRKYMFFGDFKAVSIETKDYFFFYEQHPGQLYHCDLPNGKIANETDNQIVCFFWYPDAKTCGLKVYSNNQMIRHIESESDYSITTNVGNLLENEDELIAISKSFNEQQLIQYLINLKIDIPTDIKSSLDLNPTLYTIIR